MSKISQIHSYPVKSFNSEHLDQAELEIGRGLKDDRRFAILRGTEVEGGPKLDGSAILDGSEWIPPRGFLINARVDDLLKYHLSRNENAFTFSSSTGESISFDPNDPDSIENFNKQLESFFQPVKNDQHIIPPKLVERNQDGQTPGNWDFTDSTLSILNLESVKQIEKAAGEHIDPIRFRANILIEGLTAWEEFAFIGKRFSLGEAEIEFIRPAKRCPATSIDPKSGDRNIKVPNIMQEHFGHTFCAIYARVVKKGAIQVDDKLEEIGQATLTFEQAQNDRTPEPEIWPRFANITDKQFEKGKSILTLEPNDPWPFPTAKPGQRMRLHLGQDQFTSADVVVVQDGMISVSIPPDHAINADKVIVTGPFGKAG